MEFRSDINGLRAIAVLAVMLFHFDIGSATGGYAGVDVFFVLSGFLMTSIIARGLARDDFSFAAFYASRARRILPALAALCVVLLVMGLLLLAPSDLELLTKHSNTAISFTSNFTFKDEAGYFDLPSQAKWLLHTWSLSAEWQFYLLYPLILVMVARWRGIHTLAHTLWLLLLASLVLSIVTTAKTPETAFFMLHTRLWELVAGGLVALYASQIALPAATAKRVELAGLLLIALSVFAFDENTLWPGSAALVPVIGTVLVLIAARTDSMITSNRVSAALGTWSYSIYLMHWPIVVALGLFGWRDSMPHILLGFAASIALGSLSYYAVEQPARRYFAARNARITLIATFAAMAVVIGLGALAASQARATWRVSEDVVRIDAETKNRFAHIPKNCGYKRNTQEVVPCDIREGEPVRWVVMGDSHAGSLLGAAYKTLPGGIRYYTAQCALMFNTELNHKGDRNNCTHYMDTVWQQIEALPKSVSLIVINRYAVNIIGTNESKAPPRGFTYTDKGEKQHQEDPLKLYQERLVETLCTMAKSHRVYAVKPIPEMGVDVPRVMAQRHMLGDPIQEISISRAEYDARNRVPLAALSEAQKRCGVTLLDPTPYLCDHERCYGARNRQPYYFDDDHLSESGSLLLKPMLRNVR